MTLQEVQALTDDEIRVKVAELNGWREMEWGELASVREAKERKLFCRSNELHRCEWLPNYPADLNACHEAEEAWFRSNPNPVWKYSTNLEQIVERDWEAGMPDLNSVCFYRATARQRCEALLLTLTQP